MGGACTNYPKLNATVLLDGNRNFHELGIYFIPATLFVAPDGRILIKRGGPISLDDLHAALTLVERRLRRENSAHYGLDRT